MGAAFLHLFSELSRFTAQEFFSGLWQGMVLIAGVALGLRMLPRVSPAGRFATWGTDFALVLALPVLHLFRTAVPRSSVPAVELGMGWEYGVAGVWLAAMGFRAVQLLFNGLRLRSIWRRAIPVDATQVDASVLELLQVGRRTVELCTSDDLDSPSVIGFVSPRLLIPEWLYAKLTASELRQVVLHEREHLRRGDDWINLMQKVSLVFFPLNPALLWMDRQMSTERELACDAGVVASTAAPFDYASCLTRLAGHRLTCRKVALSLSAWTRQTELTRRVYSLLRPTRRMSRFETRAAVGVLGMGLLAGGFELARAPQLVSFSDMAAGSGGQVSAYAQSSTAVAMGAGLKAVPVLYRRERPHLSATIFEASKGAKSAVVAPATTITSSVPPRPPARRLRDARPKATVGQPHIVLTAARAPAMRKHGREQAEESRPLYLIRADFPVTYAAVPFGYGWLVIQL